MKTYTILTINPGSTSTKIGLYRDGGVILDKTVDHDRKELDSFEKLSDQEPIRTEKVLEVLKENNVDLEKIDAVSGRGVGVHSCVGGTYSINDIAFEHALNDVEGIHNAAILGIVIAKKLGDKLGVPSYFVNPMSVDELCDEARMTGVKGLYRPSHGHPLNMKQVGIKHSLKKGTKYEDCNYVIMHMGGGTSIAAHKKGRIVDSTRAGDGQGAICPNRTGDICIDDVMTLIRRGMSLEEINELASRKGGLLNLCGTDDLIKVKEMRAAGDKMADLAYRAMIYTMVKWAAMMAGALEGKVDGILLTGGLAKDEELVKKLTDSLSWIAEISVYPGSFETEALGAGVERVLIGDEEVKVYTGKPVWEEFDFITESKL